jgi:hypothetical protein
MHDHEASNDEGKLTIVSFILCGPCLRYLDGILWILTQS